MRIETELNNNRAYDEKSAMDPVTSKINIDAVLQIMEETGLVSKTAEGKIYLTQKGKDQQLRGFSINKIPPHTIVRFSRNK
jgi:ribosomal protein S19E (S16A)